MDSFLIKDIKDTLDRLAHKPVKISQSGYLINQFFIKSLIYKIQNDILNLRDETNEIYLSLNLNQVYKVGISENAIDLFLDNDIEINISR